MAEMALGCIFTLKCTTCIYPIYNGAREILSYGLWRTYMYIQDRDATGSIPNFLKTSCEGAKRPRGGGCGSGVSPLPRCGAFFVFQCWIVCSGAYFRGYFHIFLHIISVFNWVLGTYCHMVIKKIKKKKKKKNYYLFGNFIIKWFSHMFDYVLMFAMKNSLWQPFYLGKILNGTVEPRYKEVRYNITLL